jgi:hypothetical protein
VAGIEMRCDGHASCIGQLGVGHTQALGDIDHQLAFTARVVNARELALGHPVALVKKEKRGGHLIEIIDHHDAVVPAHGNERLIIAGEGSGVAQCHGGALGSAPHFEDDDGNVAAACGFEHCNEPLRIAYLLKKEADDAGLGLQQRPIDIVGGGGGQFHPARYAEAESEAPIVVRERREGRTGLGNEGDATAPEPRRRGERCDAQADERIVEAHRVAAGDREASG